MMKQISQIHSAPPKHWVGNGFHVHSMFSYHDNNHLLDPFLMMDYNSPTVFPSNQTTDYKGVGEHPHRGFETVTIAYQGEVSHKDSAGGGGTIATGDVQWMTAGSGVLHQEYHSEQFSKQGGVFEMVQLWVNLPAKYKMTAPKYQALQNQNIPAITLDNQAGVVRVIAGQFQDAAGIAETFSPINMWDIRLNAEKSQHFDIPEKYNLVILVLDGSISINNQIAKANELITFERGGSQLVITAIENAKILILAGEPLDEPVVGYGPFVMNSEEEIHQAFQDFRSGKFGQI